ncbi:glucose-6-phosphate isomerase [Thermostichus vulcanus]|uniref:Glucose-6-phosphate isomerase n=1 Tax=Thermostichus vulcanus str. 'Rupite' TaxID=2813851 RepID=A0ABT0CF10_THEVL|nr:glucose-6-phosphate isomerase [Thermostichus vulcanus]MCJ2544351.1 glucose-6-phosphate isomerase [Thermostichus vulcanus str. 'Rupite']
MDSAQIWQRYCDWLYYHPGLEFFLDISRIRFTPEQVGSLQSRFAEAFAAMQALEAGAIANPDEHRQVGHYWLRAPELAPTPELTQAIQGCIEQIEAFAEKIHHGMIPASGGGRFTELLCVGIGGSALGPQFVAEALAPQHPPLNIHFIDNTDPDGIDRVLARLAGKLGQTLVIITSKSGGTPEPRNGLVEVEQAYQKAGIPFAVHAVAITSPGSKLEVQARQAGWLEVFPIFDWVGGRTSETSAVGLLPAALQGIDIRALLAGAATMDEATRVPEVKRNPAALLALAWYIAGQGQGRKDMVVLPYKDRLLLFSRYLQQLVMESLGKSHDLKGNRVEQGIAVYGNKGSTDQHAYVQQLRDGINNFFVTFIEVLQDREPGIPSPFVEPQVTSGDYLSGLLQGTRQALYENGRDSITVTIPRVDARSVGALIALYERAVGLYAALININAYHQPGVEAGKKAASAVLELQRQVIEVVRSHAGSLTLGQLAEKVGSPERIETLYFILRHLHANGREIQLIGDPGCPLDLKIQARPT